MEDHRLPRTAQNAVFATINARGLSPADFEWSEVDDGYVYSRLHHRPTGYIFDFATVSVMGDRVVMVQWTPADEDGDTSEAVHSRQGQLVRFAEWLAVVKRELEAPDLWGALRAEHAITDAARNQNDNRPFDQEELPKLDTALTELRAHLEAQHVHGAPERAQLASRFQYLREAARRGIGRIDWLNIFIAQMVSMVMVGVIPTTAYGEVMRFAAGLFRAVFDVLKVLTS